MGPALALSIYTMLFTTALLGTNEAQAFTDLSVCQNKQIVDAIQTACAPYQQVVDQFIKVSHEDRKHQPEVKAKVEITLTQKKKGGEVHHGTAYRTIHHDGSVTWTNVKWEKDTKAGSIILSRVIKGETEGTKKTAEFLAKNPDQDPPNALNRDKYDFFFVKAINDELGEAKSYVFHAKLKSGVPPAKELFEKDLSIDAKTFRGLSDAGQPTKEPDGLKNSHLERRFILKNGLRLDEYFKGESEYIGPGSSLVNLSGKGGVWSTEFYYSDYEITP